MAVEAIKPGEHQLGPESGTLVVRTGRGGAVGARVGHDLVIEVTRWGATLDLAAQPAIALSADARSLRVREGLRGLKPLDDDDRAAIAQSIDDEVLQGCAIQFHSTSVEPAADGTGLEVTGDLQLAGVTRPVAFALAVATAGRMTGSATLKQSDWGIKPFTTLFGTLKVLDDVLVEVDARLNRPVSRGSASHSEP